MSDGSVISIVVAILLLVFLLSLQFLMPGRHEKFLRWGGRHWFNRIRFIMLGLSLVFFVFLIATVESRGVTQTYLNALPDNIFLPLFKVFFLLFLIFFVAPGVAFRRFKPVKTPEMRSIPISEMRTSSIPVVKGNKTSKIAVHRFGFAKKSILLPRPMPITKEDIATDFKENPIKSVFLLLPMFFVFAGMYGMVRPTFLPNAGLLTFFVNYANAIVLSMTFLILLTGMREPKPDQVAPKLPKPFRWVLGFVFFGFFILLAANPAITHTLPWIASFFQSSEISTVEMEVLKQGRGRQRRGCDNTVHLVWPNKSGIQTKVCGIPNNVWESLEPGDHLIFTGNATRFGMTYESVKLLKQ